MKFKTREKYNVIRQAENNDKNNNNNKIITIWKAFHIMCSVTECVCVCVYIVDEDH